MLYQGTLFIGEGINVAESELVKVPTPQSYGWSVEDLDSEEGTGRNNATGEMFRDRVATKRKLSFTWPPLSIQDTSRLLKALSPVFITVKYLDAEEGDYVIKNFYAGPKSADCGHRSRWLGLSANLIEK